ERGDALTAQPAGDLRQRLAGRRYQLRELSVGEAKIDADTPRRDPAGARGQLEEDAREARRNALEGDADRALAGVAEPRSDLRQQARGDRRAALGDPLEVTRGDVQHARLRERLGALLGPDVGGPRG